MAWWEIVLYFILLIIVAYADDCRKEWEQLSKEEQQNTSVWEFVKEFVRSKFGK